MLKTGIDLVEIARFKQSLSRYDFKSKVFGDKEILALDLLCHDAQVCSAAGWFAAKEAFSKALGTGLRGFLWRDIQIIHNDLGAPEFFLSGNALKACQEKFCDISLSISHTDNFAVAMVTAILK